MCAFKRMKGGERIVSSRSVLSLDYVISDIHARFVDHLKVVCVDRVWAVMPVDPSTCKNSTICKGHRVGKDIVFYEDAYAHSLDKYFAYGVYSVDINGEDGVSDEGVVSDPDEICTLMDVEVCVDIDSE